ncbi:MAG: hypothetical protein K2H46_04125 [Muribaculaceae bacterium]|nr:hypothetical protein [Muribaculaceae bacterium]
MITKEFIDLMNSAPLIKGDSPIHEVAHRLRQEAIRISIQIKYNYPNHYEMIAC